MSDNEKPCIRHKRVVCEPCAIRKFAVDVISEISRTYDQNFCASDAIEIIKKQIIKNELH